jgi:hypothetical protein
MPRARTVAPSMEAPTHNGIVKRCLTMTECAVHTVSLPEGHFTALVHSNPGPDGKAVIDIIDHDEVEALIILMRNSVEDAKRLDSGRAAINATPSLRRN